MTHNIPVVEVKPPSAITLRKYGLTADEWMAHWKRQGCVCAVCGKFKTNLVTDHEHYANWKKLPPEVRKSFIRGVICNWCNRRIVGRGATPRLLLSGAKYLRDYEKRRKHEYS